MDNFKLPTENAFLMFQARESLKGKWRLAVITFLIYFLIMSLGGVFSSLFPFTVISYKTDFLFSILPPLVALLIAGPMGLGAAIFSLSISRNAENTDILQIFEAFREFDSFINSFILGLFVILFVCFGLILLIVPGIIIYLSYSMAFYIMADNREIKPMDALSLSKKMMLGNKSRLFFLYCRFIGWYFLSFLTAGIGFLWFFPYFNVSVAKFYEDLKQA